MIERFTSSAENLRVGHYFVWTETCGADTAIICVRSIEHVGDDVVINDSMTMSESTRVICLGRRVVFK